MKEMLPMALLGALAELVDRQLGLHFPSDRTSDLQRGIAAAAGELGFTDPETCARALLSRPLERPQRDVLARHLTVGETYFFRDKPTFDALQHHVLPELVRARRGRDQHLRVWSAACCTGEEVYSLAICVRQAIADVANWRITLLGTDLNPGFLQKAERGIYSEWSFRNTPPEFKQNYFTRPAAGQWQIVPEVRRMVTFSPLNLAADVYPSLEHNTQAMDLIFCRNALIYFTAERAVRVVRDLSQCLTASGWLALGPNEVSYASSSVLTPVNFAGSVLHCRASAAAPAVSLADAAAVPRLPMTIAENERNAAVQPATSLPEPAVASPFSPDGSADVTLPPDFEQAQRRIEEGRPAEAVSILTDMAAAGAGHVEPRVLNLLAHARASQGQLNEAIEACDQILAADKLNHTAHYLRASILQELGDLVEAERALKRALYLEPDFVLAHFALGNLARQQGKRSVSERHFDNALALARAHQADEILPEADGLTFGRLAELIAAIRAMKAVA